jgi:hypothetical protein
MEVVINLKHLFILDLFLCRVSVIGSGTTLQAERSRVRFPVRSLDFLVDLTLPVVLRPFLGERAAGT